MRVAIFKYQLALGNNQIEMPLGAKILHVSYVPGQQIVAMWAQVDPNEKNTVVRSFYGVATGEVFDSTGTEYIGTIVTPTGYVFHYHEVKF